MQHGLISGDNHIDLTYCPPDLWSSRAPAKWRLLVPRVEELEDGLHWFVEGHDQGMWNGVGPRFLKYEPGVFGHIDEMKASGFTWDYRRGAQPRPTTPALRLADLDRDGVDAEIIYGCLMVNELIENAGLRAWTNQVYNDWAADFAKRSDPDRIFPLAIIPNTDPLAAAAEVRRCAKLGLRGGDLAFKRLSVPLYHRGWDALWEAAQECRFPISFHSTGFKGLRAPDTPQMEKEYAVPWRLVRSSLFQLDGMEVLVSMIASGACERYPELQVRPRRVRRDLDPLRLRSPGHGVRGPGPGPRVLPEAQRLLPAAGVHHLPAGSVSRARDPHRRRGQHHLGGRLSASRLSLARFRRHLEKNLGGLSERVRRKITGENVAKLYQLPAAARAASGGPEDRALR